MAFSYYERLSPADQRTYRRSDRIGALPLPTPDRLWPVAMALAAALENDDRDAVEKAANRLCAGITRSLGIQGVRVRVLARRPRRAGSELHGLYTLESDGRAHIEVWMRTAHQRRVVTSRTFLRTLLHEVCHHLDLVFFELSETFHTKGFFRRESSLVRQIVGSTTSRNAPAASSAAIETGPRRAMRATVQLGLF